MKTGDRVLVEGVVTRVRDGKVSVAFRVAERVGSSYPGSSATNKVIDGVVRRTTEVPLEDVRSTG